MTFLPFYKHGCKIKITVAVKLNWIVSDDISKHKPDCLSGVFNKTTFLKSHTVAAHLRGLWTVATWAKGLTRPIVSKLKTEDWKLHIHILHSFSSILYKWYVLVTYQPSAHICNSCNRCVVVTYRSIICTSCKKHVSYGCNSGELISKGTEQLRNKRTFKYSPYCFFILLSGAIFKTNLKN